MRLPFSVMISGSAASASEAISVRSNSALRSVLIAVPFICRQAPLRSSRTKSMSAFTFSQGKPGSIST